MMAGLCRDRTLFCGAVIISNRFALTAAHCLTVAKELKFTPGLLVGAHQLDRGEGNITLKSFYIKHTKKSLF